MSGHGLPDGSRPVTHSAARKQPVFHAVVVLLALSFALGVGIPAAAAEAMIWTDKADYAPEETVTIFGAGFLAETVVEVEVTRPDGHADSWTVVSDTNSEFTTTYVLDGVQGSYLVTATDGVTVATTTFTDHTPVPTNLVATAMSTSQIDLTWDGPQPAATGQNLDHHYHIERCTGTAAACSASQGPNYAGAAGTNAWTNPNNAVSSTESTCATATSVVSGFWNSYGFSIPGGAIVEGILVELKVSKGGNPAAEVFVVVGKTEGTLGTEKTGPGLANAPCGAGQSIQSFGGSADKWGLSWTPAETNSASFTVRVRTDDANERRLNWIRVTVYYHFFAEIATTSTAAGTPNTYSDTGLPSGTTESYRVRFHHHPSPAVFSDYSNIAQATTLTDTTPPAITKSIPGSPQFASGGNTYLTSATTLRVSVTETGSGLASCTISIDGPGSNDASFSCSTGDNDFSLGGKLVSPPDGSYVISATATDNAGNVGTDPLTVILDNTPPALTKTIDPPVHVSGSTTYVRSNTNIRVAATDAGSGLASCTRSIDGGGAAAYSQGTSFTLPSPDGPHTLAVSCTDNLGNSNALFETDIVDDTAPTIDKAVSGQPRFTDGLGSVYVSSSTTLQVELSDSGSGIATCGITVTNSIGDTVLGPTCATGSNEFTLPNSLPDGAYTVAATATDNVDNEADDPLTVILDNTAPALTKTIGSPKHTADGTTYVKSTTPISVSVVEGGSGLSGCTLSGDTQNNGAYSPGSDFTLPTPDGSKSFTLTCTDYLGNEGSLSETDVVDDTAPTLTKTIDDPKFVSGGITYVTSSTNIRLAASDAGSGLAGCTLAIDGGAAGAYTQGTDFTLPTPDGTHTLAVSCADHLGNSGLLEETDTVDDTAPAIAKAVPGGPQFTDASGNLYVTSSTTVQVDVTETGSGLASCTISIDGPASSDTSFACANGVNDFTLGGVLSSPPDGSYVISAAANDNLGNVGNDPLTLILDNTPPRITVTSPMGVYILNQPGVVADFACDDGTGSGVASCLGTQADGSSVDTSSTVLGTNLFEVDATDNLGNTAMSFESYFVQYSQSCGRRVLSPLEQVSDPSQLTKAYKRGSTLPIKFQLCDYFGSYVGTAVAAVGVRKVSSATDLGDVVEVLDSGSSNDNGVSCRYDSVAQHYIYNLSTKAYSGGTYRLVISLDDGTMIITYFQVRS